MCTCSPMVVCSATSRGDAMNPALLKSMMLKVDLKTGHITGSVSNDRVINIPCIRIAINKAITILILLICLASRVLISPPPFCRTLCLRIPLSIRHRLKVSVYRTLPSTRIQSCRCIRALLNMLNVILYLRLPLNTVD